MLYDSSMKPQFHVVNVTDIRAFSTQPFNAKTNGFIKNTSMSPHTMYAVLMNVL